MRLRLVPEVTNINFFRTLRMWLAISALGVLASLVAVATVGLNFGVDFRGGTLIIAATPEAEDVGAFRDVLTALDVGDVAVTEISDDSGAGRHLVLMRLGIAGEDPDSQAAVIAEVRQALEASFPGIEFLQVDSVGAKVSSELARSGFLAVGLAFLAVMVYVWLRFEWQFSVGAVISLIHDAILTVGIFSILRLEFNLTIVAAILTVIGYSINDTVVVFDRVRENLRKYKKLPLVEVMNLSLNETLSRTVMTSATTLLALLAIYFFGGDVISGFAFAVMWGVLVGTYSSIYLATATVLRFGVKRDWSKPDAAAGTQFSKADA
jgi:preprotein translocase subunit SecF